MTTSKVSFDPFSDDFFNAPFATYRRMRDEAPVYYNEIYDFYALTRHEDVTEALKDHQTYSSSRGIDLAMVQSGQPVPPLIIMMDPPAHRRMRSLVNKVFTPRAIERQRQTVIDTIDHYLDAADPEHFDVVQDFSALFPVEVITEMLGVPKEQRQDVRLLLDKQLAREYGNIEMPEEGIQAGIQTGLMYYNIIQEHRAHPQDDMISDLIDVEIERDGEMTKLDDIEITGFASLLGGAGAETVTKLVGNAVVTFADYPEQWQELIEDRSKIPAAVEELLRWEAPAQYLVRYSMRDIELHGTTIPAGKPVLLCLGSANRDERAFTAADSFDIDRDRAEAQNVGLGYGIHSCLGAALARMECAIALDKLLDWMPRYELVRSGLKRVAMTNVVGWYNVPVRVLR
ncbi:cytochrome P450 [Mycolicibacterium insubricum]|uniref:Steroid C26-monooxygenase n=1 Tax=Mycolicibacterium insubricum TaxID=444597 RepID=A0A1X0D166_9MYCO|nr:cytochrome P450 [Mycolicibacterium insubricum]MCB9441667.1 cytochrome P450 [Mycolicibacterium sp.]MCV7080332.1 cytochrome P450 [Mycolicibacterium insubricum]ORA66113.1 cytochrome [Mycolicibacterium insubricum]BBZ67268.1 cytochrome P450 [Mycolicibacterium insubricum]